MQGVADVHVDKGRRMAEKREAARCQRARSVGNNDVVLRRYSTQSKKTLRASGRRADDPHRQRVVTRRSRRERDDVGGLAQCGELLVEDNAEGLGAPAVGAGQHVQDSHALLDRRPIPQSCPRTCALGPILPRCARS